jgi:hypothetical protein
MTVKLLVGNGWNPQQKWNEIYAYLQVEKVEDIIDTEDTLFALKENEALVEASDMSVTLVSEGLMDARRLQNLGVERFFTLPMQSYDLLAWLYEHGERSPNFLEREHLPVCDLCQADYHAHVPAAYLVTGPAGDFNLCPDHKRQQHNWRVVSVLMERSQ